ncbi:MAG: glycerol-3-phosphate dehydrogenase/oxidase [Candidatus Omnitrophica bacterium]|nr:glycerol-3-phosphate dehydrogenase/oxidase [Candidatus Omnitrophota bacterium]
MRRDLDGLKDKVFDLAVVGGGIYGAFCAWDAALRGLSCVLLEKDDFGGATSANSQRILHGGLRYLQYLDFKRMRESIRERGIWMKIAPHLVRVMPFLMPTYAHGPRQRWMLRGALMVNDLVGWDRNTGLEDPGRRFPAGAVLSREEVIQRVPGVKQEGLTGGVIWYDAQMTHSERLTLAVVKSAGEAGARVANYAEVKGFLRSGSRIAGVRVRDHMRGKTRDISARVILNAGGPWLSRIAGLAGIERQPVRFTQAVNIVTKPFLKRFSLATPISGDGPGGARILCMTPWRDVTIVGTNYFSLNGNQDAREVSEEKIQTLIDAVNDGCPGAITRDDVLGVQSGLLPLASNGDARGSMGLMSAYSITDHTAEGLEGFISVLGVKYTTARDVAAKTVDRAVKKLGRSGLRSSSHKTSLAGGSIGHLDSYVRDEIRKRPASLSPDVIRRLIENYGTGYTEVLEYIKEDGTLIEPLAPGTPVTRAEVVHAVRMELAQHLADVVFRRTDLGTQGFPGEAALNACVAIMARELGWDSGESAQELERVMKRFRGQTLCAESVA